MIMLSACSRNANNRGASRAWSPHPSRFHIFIRTGCSVKYLAEIDVLDCPMGTVDLPLGPDILRAIWLGDAVVLIQDFIESPNLAQSLSTSDLPWAEAQFALTFLRSLVATVVSAHEKKIAHGDIKPENILVITEESPRPLFVDLLDFVHVDDGEKMSRA
jgi:serine/threonine protein kinase